MSKREREKEEEDELPLDLDFESLKISFEEQHYPLKWDEAFPGPSFSWKMDARVVSIMSEFDNALASLQSTLSNSDRDRKRWEREWLRGWKEEEEERLPPGDDEGGEEEEEPKKKQ